MKRQSLQWKISASPRPKKARMSRAQVKTMLICSFDHKGIVHCEFLEQGRTVNQHCYLKHWQGYVRLFVGEELNFGLMIGSCIMTIPLLMTRSLSGRFWFFDQEINSEIGPSTIFARFGPVRHLTVPKTEYRFEGRHIFRHCRHSGTCDDHPTEHSRRGVPEMF
jgi:hypothetical protein